MAMLILALIGLYSLATFIPSIAVAIRRLHDVGKSGWMLLVVFIPLLGGIWLLVLYCTDSQPGDNEYGPIQKKRSYNLHIKTGEWKPCYS